MNRVTDAIGRMRKQIRDRIAQGLTDEARVEESRRALDLDLGEFALFQERKSLAFAEGVLTQEEAQTVSRLLGATPAHFNQQDCATKAVLTRLFQDLLQIQARAK